MRRLRWDCCFGLIFSITSTIKCRIMKIGHMAQFQFFKLQDDRSVSTQCRQRTDLGTPAGKLYVHAAYMRVPMLKRKTQQLT